MVQAKHRGGAAAPVDAVEAAFFSALKRLQAGKPKNKELLARAKAGKLRVTVASVAKEAGHSRTLIGHDKCPYPKVRDMILALRRDPDQPSTMKEVVIRRREEAAKLRRELKLAQTENATLLSRILRLETEVTRVSRENKRRRDRLPVANLVKFPSSE